MIVKKDFFIILFLIMILSCNQNSTSSKLNGQVESLTNSTLNLKGFQIWQLDNYPDSLLINKSINDNSGWSSAYAYNIRFSKDSCQFIGWHESWWNKLIKIDDKSFKTDYESQYWELKFVSNEKLLMREVFVKMDKTDTGKYFSYHKVLKILSMDSLNQKVAKDIFAGKYKVIFNDTLNVDNIVEFDNKYGVKGIKDVKGYSFETSINWDFPVFNAFGFTPNNDNKSNGLSFRFSGDTLFIKDYKIIRVDGDFDHVEIAKTRLIMIKIK